MVRARLASRILCGALLLGLFFTEGAGSLVPSVMAQDASQAGLNRFVEGLWPAARARGASRATFDEVRRGVSAESKKLAVTKKQPELMRPSSDYINGAVSAQRLERGRELATQWDSALDAVDRT